jgi:hypothetical protein
VPITTTHNTAFMSVSVDTDKKCVRHQIHQFAQGKDLRDGLDAGVALLQQHHVKKWLSDDRKNGPLTAADGEWVFNSWIPRAIAAGWRTWALVQPQSVIGQMNMKKFTDDFAKKGVVVQVFGDPGSAQRWLDQQP